jgi:hypothetical protein
LDFGDIPSIGPEISEYLGGTAGALSSFAAAPVTGGGSLLTVPAAAGLGAAAGREMYGRLAGPILGTQDARGIGERLADTASTVGMNAVGQRVGDLVGRGLRSVIGSAGGRQAVADAQSIGVDLPAGALGNRGVQTVEHALSNTPGGAGPIAGAYDKAMEQARKAAENLARQFGITLSPQGAGATIKEGAEAAGARFAETVKQFGNRLYSVVGADRRVPGAGVREARKFFADAVTSDPGLERTYAPILRELTEITEGANRTGGITFRALHRLRMKIGAAMAAPDASDYRGVAGEELKRVYAALSRDMEQAAQNAGPDAERLMKAHDRYIKLNQNVNMPTLNAVARTGDDAAALNWAMSGAKDSGQRLARLRRNMTPEEWDTVAGSVLNRLGRAKPGVQGGNALSEEAGDFSVSTFLTNWNSLSPQARKALWGGTRYADLEAPLNTLVRVIDRLKDAGKLANTSGTARSVGPVIAATSFIGTLFSSGLEPAAYGAAAYLIAPNVAARLLTNPTVVGWLSRAELMYGRSPNALSAHVGRLLAIAKANPAMREEIGQMITAMRAVGIPIPEEK